jgi:nicotinamide phosphoribosyltransferase
MHPILYQDSYKHSHYLQLPPGTTQTFAYLESRGGEYDRTLFFGLQAILKEEFCKPIKLEDIEMMSRTLAAHGLPFNRDAFWKIWNDYDGYLPLEIRAVEEGSIVPTKNALLTVTNTDPAFAWLPAFVETALLRVWYPITVATISWNIRNLIRESLIATSDNWEAELPFKLHDFGARGVSSFQSAGLGGLAHLVNFEGTDTLPAILACQKYYHDFMPGFSIPASEHSTMTSWGRDGEADAYENMIKAFGKEGSIFAVVSDSYDIYHAVDEIWGKKLRQKVIDCGATVVIRPDSGDPKTTVLKTIQLLADRFSYHYNQRGFKVLNNVRVIQGDGVNYQSIADILDLLTKYHWSGSNISFGMGGALLQHCNRDTQKFAYKISAAKINGEWRDVYKDPVTDPGKRSKRGVLALVQDERGNFMTVPADPDTFQAAAVHPSNMLEVVYRNGKLIKDVSLTEVRDMMKAFSY